MRAAAYTAVSASRIALWDALHSIRIRSRDIRREWNVAVLPVSTVWRYARREHYPSEVWILMDRIREATYQQIEKDKTSMLYRFTHNSFLRGEDMIYRGAPSMVVAAVNPRMLAARSCETVDPVIALSYLELYAQSLGLGTLWDDAILEVMESYPDVLRMTGTPNGYYFSFALLLGVPDVTYKRVVKKEPVHVSII